MARYPDNKKKKEVLPCPELMASKDHPGHTHNCMGEEGHVEKIQDMHFCKGCRRWWGRGQEKNQSSGANGQAKKETADG